jgi:glycosyltransferase involved in cell wall biosynthesis
MKVIFYMPDVIGGVYSVVNNIISNCSYPYKIQVVAYSDECIQREKIKSVSSNSELIKFVYNGKDNAYHTAKRLYHSTAVNAYTLVASDMLELQMVELLELNIPVIYMVMGDFGHYYDTTIKYQFIIDKFIAISGEIYNNLIKLLPTERHQDIELIYFPTPRVQKIRENNKNSSFSIIYVARLEDGKNPLILPEINSILISKGINVNWTIVGDGPLRASLEEKLSGLNNFTLLGFLNNDKLHQAYLKNQLFILPSESEGLPVSMIEAMKTGLVPVVSDISGGIREVVKNGENGFLCNHSNPVEFAKRIEELIRNPRKMEQFSSACVKLANQLFDPEIASNTYFQAYLDASQSKRTKQFNAQTPGALDKRFIPNFMVRLMRKYMPDHH